jgi:hypothetical protein
MDTSKLVSQLVCEYTRVNTEITNGIMNGKFNAEEANKLLFYNSQCFQGNVSAILGENSHDGEQSQQTNLYYLGKPLDDKNFPSNPSDYGEVAKFSQVKE